MKSLLIFTTLFLIVFVSFTQNKPEKLSTSNLIASTGEITLYPNPILNNDLNIKAYSNILAIDIINVIGRSVIALKFDFPTKYQKINVSQCEKGLYLIKITTDDNKVVIRKVFIK